MLAEDEASINNVWHLPTSNPGLTGRAFVEIAAKALGVPPRMSVLTKWMLRLAGLGDKTIRELYEMLYQNEFEYEFDSTKFNKHFNYVPTPYPDGIAKMVRFKENS